jgi:hypothetical protein
MYKKACPVNSIHSTVQWRVLFTHFNHKVKIIFQKFYSWRIIREILDMQVVLFEALFTYLLVPKFSLHYSMSLWIEILLGEGRRSGEPQVYCLIKRKNFIWKQHFHSVELRWVEYHVAESKFQYTYVERISVRKASLPKKNFSKNNIQYMYFSYRIVIKSYKK